MERMLRHGGAVDGRLEAAAQVVRVELRDGGEVRTHEAVDRQRLQIGDLRLRHPELGEQLARDARALLAVNELQRRAAHDDGAVEESLRGRHREQVETLRAPPD